MNRTPLINQNDIFTLISTYKFDDSNLSTNWWFDKNPNRLLQNLLLNLKNIIQSMCSTHLKWVWQKSYNLNWPRAPIASCNTWNFSESKLVVFIREDIMYANAVKTHIRYWCEEKIACCFNRIGGCSGWQTPPLLTLSYSLFDSNCPLYYVCDRINKMLYTCHFEDDIRMDTIGHSSVYFREFFLLKIIKIHEIIFVKLHDFSLIFPSFHEKWNL